MDHQLERQSDTLANAASRLVALSMGDSVCFQMMLSKLVNYALKSNIMGMENIWLKLVEDYYRLGVVTWVDSSHLASIEREYDKLRYNRIGMTAYNMPLSDPDGKKVNLFDTGKKYTLLYFFEPSCGHCKETTPKVYEQIYKKYAEKGLDVVAVYMLTDKQEWMDFVEEKHLKGEHWHNLWDPDRKSSYWKYYDTSVTPAVYVLDENKKIIAKKIDVETMDIVFAKFLNPAPAE
jgi:thiol-disulfide isomerase/thioredoxin